MRAEYYCLLLTSEMLARTVKSLSSMPGPPSLPLVGSSLLYRFGRRDKTEYHLALLDMYREYGPVVREDIGGRTIGRSGDSEEVIVQNIS